MSNGEVTRLIAKTKNTFPKAFINHNNELIIEPKNNIYFRLEDVENELDFKCKMIAWLSRPSIKGVSEYWQNIFLKGFNEILETNFTKDEMDTIYTYLGNDVNRSLSIKFIESKYDLSLLGKR